MPCLQAELRFSLGMNHFCASGEEHGMGGNGDLAITLTVPIALRVLSVTVSCLVLL